MIRTAHRRRSAARRPARSGETPRMEQPDIPRTIDADQRPRGEPEA